jgi:transcription elongation factor Elf1
LENITIRFLFANVDYRLGNSLTKLAQRSSMGKRKSTSFVKQQNKTAAELDTLFACVFCKREKSVRVKLLRKKGCGHLSCRLCGVTFQSNINCLSESVDVYSEWIDACDAAAKVEAVRNTVWLLEGEEAVEEGYEDYY